MGALTVHDKGEDLPLLDCGESGSTLRFLIPVALALRGGGRFTGRGRLMERPQEPYFAIFEEKGISYSQENGVLTVRGALTSGEYRLPGDVSSQFVTGLLYALPLLTGESVIRLTSPLESRGYVDLTLDTLARFGIRVENREYECFTVRGGQRFQPYRMVVERDYSQAAFFLTARALGSEVTVTGMNQDSAQGDRVIFSYLARLDQPGTVTLDVSQCPDLVPALALRAALRNGETTRITSAARLRIKESDRLDTVTTELNRLGAQVEQGPDFLTVTGVAGLTGGTADSHNDHRIAMMLAVAATRCSGPLTVRGAESVAKSYPAFWSDYERLGGNITCGI
jgi:3-phosphoshikimate 1-carboxyvinyltransferase